MAYTETTSVGFLDRLGSSFRGIIVGVVLIVAGTVLLWWNEGDFVATRDSLNEAQAITQELGDINTVDSSKNGVLVHASGPTSTEDIVKDDLFGITVNAVRLERKVEFYQWVESSKTETKNKLGGGQEKVTTYTYSQKWVNSPVNSSSFKDPSANTNYRNTVLMTLDNFRDQARNVSFGAYRLPEFMISSISGATSLNVTLSEETMARLNKQLASRAAQDAPRTVVELYTNESSEETPQSLPSMVHVSASTVMLSASPSTPQIGDVRITFSATYPAPISILAKVVGNSFEAYRASNGKTVSRLDMGTHSLENMYGDAHSSNATITWILRLVGTILIIVGLKMIMAPLAVLASVIPLLGSIVGAGAGIVSILLGLAWSLVIIAIAWLRFRPVMGVIMLVVAGGFIALLYLKGRARKAAAKAQAPATQP